MTNAQHSSKSDQWFTPPWLVDMVKQVLGPIDLDPASSELANRYVRAKHIITEGGERWPSARTLFLNPPGGRVGNQSKAIVFWRFLQSYRAFCPAFGHAIYLAFSLEQLQTSQGKGCPSIGDFTLCIPKRRIRYYGPDWEPGPSPTHSSAIVYVPGTVDRTDRFVEVFKDLGAILNAKG